LVSLEPRFLDLESRLCNSRSRLTNMAGFP
jgi:hypothetical protein